MYISENLSPDSHTDDIISGIEAKSKLVEKVNYTEMYESVGKNEFESYIVTKIKENNIEIAIFAIGASMIIDLFLLKKINELNKCKIIVMLSDSEHLFEINDRYYAQAADLVWLLSPATEDMFRLYGCNVVWTQGFDMQRYPVGEMNKCFDVSFVGGIQRSNRLEYINYLKDNGINVELAGYGTNRGLISTQEKNEIVYKSKINLNFTGVENKDKRIFQRVKQPKGRPMEVSMLGGFTLSEYSYGMEKMFDIDTEIDVFHNKEELLDKVKFYLENDVECNKKAQRAYQRAVNDYETKNSFTKVLNELSKINHANKTYFIDEEFSSRFTSTRFYHFTKFLLSAKYKAAYNELSSIRKYKNLSLRNVYFDIPRGMFHTLDAKTVYVRKVFDFAKRAIDLVYGQLSFVKRSL
jgi:hypothetical protein